MKDSNGTIQFMNVMRRWCLPQFDDNNNNKLDLFTWQAHRMSNYLRHLLTKQLDITTTNPLKPEKRFVPCFFRPILNEGEAENKKVDIKPHHVEQLYDVMMARMVQGDIMSVPDMYSTRSWFNHNAPAVDNMPRDCLQDLTWLLHFVDDWELDDNDFEWDEVFNFPKHDHDHDDYDAAHHVKFGLFEDAYVKRWQECVKKFGKWVTADKLRLAGWFHSPCTIGPNPKPIRTGATLHSLAVTRGKLQFYKLYAQMYGGKLDNDLQSHHSHAAGQQKFVNLFNIMLLSFRGKGHHVTCDSAYMGDIMALIARNLWKINMVGTIQANQTGANMGPLVKGPLSMNVKSYEYKMWQHNTQSLLAAVWSDNNLVKTLSNYHEPQIVAAGMLRRKIGPHGVREKNQSEVDAPIQNVDYFDTYYQIDKSNQV